MAKARSRKELLLLQIGGESLDESGFEDETPDPLYSDEERSNPPRSDDQKERNDVH